MIRSLLMLVMSLTAAGASPPNPVNQRLLAMDEATRNATLRQAVTNADQPCGRLDVSLYTRRYANLEMWTARCTPGGQWGVFIGPDGTAQVRACATLPQLGLPPCAVLPPPKTAKPRRR